MAYVPLGKPVSTSGYVPLAQANAVPSTTAKIPANPLGNVSPQLTIGGSTPVVVSKPVATPKPAAPVAKTTYVPLSQALPQGKPSLGLPTLPSTTTKNSTAPIGDLSVGPSIPERLAFGAVDAVDHLVRPFADAIDQKSLTPIKQRIAESLNKFNPDFFVTDANGKMVLDNKGKPIIDANKARQHIATYAAFAAPDIGETGAGDAAAEYARQQFLKNAAKQGERTLEAGATDAGFMYRGSGKADPDMIRTTLGNGRYYAADQNVAREYGDAIQTARRDNLNLKNIDHLDYEDMVQPEYLKLRDAPETNWDGKYNSATKIMAQARDVVNKKLALQGYDGIDTEIAGKKMTMVFPEAVNKVVHDDTVNKYHAIGEGPKASTQDIQALLDQHLPKGSNVKVVFDKNLLANEGSYGSFSKYHDVITDELKPVIRLYENGGKAGVRTAFHESWHYLEDAMPKADLATLRKETFDQMTEGDKAYYKARGYKTNDAMASEYMADEWGKHQADRAGYKSTIQTVIDKLNAFIQKIVDASKDLYQRIKETPNKQGGFIKNPFDRVSSDIAEKSQEVSILRDALDAHPAKPLSLYANNNGELPEVLGGVSSKFGRSGDDIVTQHGFSDSETARNAYQDYRKGQARLRVAQQQLANLRAQKTSLNQATIKKPVRISAEGVPMALNARQKAMLESKLPELPSFSNISESQPQPRVQTPTEQAPLVNQPVKKVTASDRKPSTPATIRAEEARSLERLAGQAKELTSEGYIPDSNAYQKIVVDMQTPVKKQVNWPLDIYFRTPDRVMNKIGFGNEARMLRRAMDGYWKELPTNIDRITEWSKRVPSQAANERIFDFLDGDKDVKLSKTEAQVAGEIKTWLRQWADRLGLKEDSRVSDYITRIWDKEFQAGKPFPEDIANIIAGKVPGSVYNPFTMKRLGGKGYKRDTWAALDAYVKRGTRAAYMDPVLEKIQQKTGSSLELSNVEKSQFKFIQRYIENINMRPSEKEEGLDTLIKNLPIVGNKFGQRPTAYISRKLRQAVFRGMIGLNPASALRNLSQGANTYAVLGEKYTALGYLKLFQKGASKELDLEGILNAGFVEDRVTSATKKTIQKLDKGMFFLFEQAEKINRGAAYFGAKSKALSEGKTMPEAIEYAKQIVRKTQFTFDAIDTPVGLGNNLAKTFFQFQSFTIKQSEFLAEQALSKNYAGLIRFTLSSLLFVYTVGKLFGMKPRDILPTYRFGVPASLKLPYDAIKGIVGVPNQYGQAPTLKSTLKDLTYDAKGYVPGVLGVTSAIKNIQNLRGIEPEKKSSSKKVGGLPKLGGGAGLPTLPKLPKLPKM